MQKSRYSPFSTSSSRTVILATALALAACLLVMPAMANPPSDVSVQYDKTISKLSVTITHPVDDPAAHYISNVKINQNGRIVIDNDYNSQPAKDTFTIIYPVQVNAGDTIRVTATCVLAGSKEGVLTLPTPTSTAPPTIPQTTIPAAPAPTTQKSPTGLMPILGLGFCAVLALALRK